MAARKNPEAQNLRQELLQPLAGYRHKEVPVPTSKRKVIVREPGADDWLEWQARLQAVAGEEVTEDNSDAVSERISRLDDHTPEAAMLVRVLIDPQTYDRIFSDEDVDSVAASWGPVYGRFLNAALELAGLTTATPVEDAKKN
ncbi:tail assembly chaperone [Halomonas phage vB_HmeY_H4907]|nr:tail assembly chaperone [Halomonas phage vB_HmeY_H4907]